jgi:alkanesulfonate monooxygenase SsuD/methylene tetrahydromethanopterin reductase-like flavin-dependent oxidoreductase (luciferase family)
MTVEGFPKPAKLPPTRTPEETLLDRPAPSQRARLDMHNANALKLGLFGVNCSSGRAPTKVPERWSASWEDCLALARMADVAGIDFMLPIGRWKGYGGLTDMHGETLETITWATGLLAHTERITVFGTVHAPLFHPIIAAKQCVTADHIGEGRFGLNIVAGWNEGEFEMFGVKQRDHEARYEYGQEWVDAVKLAWEGPDDFDFKGEYITLTKVRAKPKPYGGSRPIIMNAGASPTGRAFAIRNCEAFFTNANRHSLEATAQAVTEAKADARTQGRDIDVYTVGVVTCKPTQREADDYYRHCIVEHADWSAVDAILAKRRISEATVGADEFKQQRLKQANGMGGLPLVGDPDHVARELLNLSKAGLRGIGLSFVNFADELPYFCDEVLPRLERAGVRVAR